MVDQTFLHFPGIGPATEQRIFEAGLSTWSSVLQAPESLPFRGERRTVLLRELGRCQEALEKEDLSLLVDSLIVREQWRILAKWRERLTYFDIETSGLSYDDYITVVACYHKGQVHQFVRGENLDDFLELLDDVDLLVSFNGGTFDVPLVLRTWHIQELPCAHIDLRWQCYHVGLRGGLKEVEQLLDIRRSSRLEGIDGFEAVLLWSRWEGSRDAQAREKLLAYCRQDVLSLRAINDEILRRRGFV